MTRLLVAAVTFSLWCFKMTAADEMLVYDTSNETNRYRFTCPPDGGFCLSKGAYQSSEHGPTDPLEAIRSTRYATDGYLFTYELLTGAAFCGVNFCTTNTSLPDKECSMTCDSPCECRMKEGEGLGPADLPCTVLEVIPDVSIASEKEMIYFNSTVFGNDDHVEFRCPGQFQKCEQTSLDGQYGYFSTTSSVTDSDSAWAVDYFNCTDQSPGIQYDTCLVKCDPRCTCAQIIGGDTVECGTFPNPLDKTEAPTSMPSPSAAWSSATLSLGISSCAVVVVSLAWNVV